MYQNRMNPTYPPPYPAPNYYQQQQQPYPPSAYPQPPTQFHPQATYFQGQQQPQQQFQQPQQYFSGYLPASVPTMPSQPQQQPRPQQQQQQQRQPSPQQPQPYQYYQQTLHPQQPQQQQRQQQQQQEQQRQQQQQQQQPRERPPPLQYLDQQHNRSAPSLQKHMTVKETAGANVNTVGPSYSLGHGRIDVPSNFQKPPEAAVDSALLLANVEEPATTTPTSFAIDGEGHRAGGGEAASGGFETEKLGREDKEKLVVDETKEGPRKHSSSSSSLKRYLKKVVGKSDRPNEDNKKGAASLKKSPCCDMKMLYNYGDIDKKIAVCSWCGLVYATASVADLIKNCETMGYTTEEILGALRGCQDYSADTVIERIEQNRRLKGKEGPTGQTLQKPQLTLSAQQEGNEQLKGMKETIMSTVELAESLRDQGEFMAAMEKLLAIKMQFLQIGGNESSPLLKHLEAMELSIRFCDPACNDSMQKLVDECNRLLESPLTEDDQAHVSLMRSMLEGALGDPQAVVEGLSVARLISPERADWIHQKLSYLTTVYNSFEKRQRGIPEPKTSSIKSLEDASRSAPKTTNPFDIDDEAFTYLRQNTTPFSEPWAEKKVEEQANTKKERSNAVPRKETTTAGGTIDLIDFFSTAEPKATPTELGDSTAAESQQYDEEVLRFLQNAQVSDPERYAKFFFQNEVDMDLMRTMTEDDLKEIGVSALGARRRISRAIDGLTAAKS